MSPQMRIIITKKAPKMITHFWFNITVCRLWAEALKCGQNIPSLCELLLCHFSTLPTTSQEKKSTSHGWHKWPLPWLKGSTGERALQPSWLNQGQVCRSLYQAQRALSGGLERHFSLLNPLFTVGSLMSVLCGVFCLSIFQFVKFHHCPSLEDGHSKVGGGAGAGAG